MSITTAFLTVTCWVSVGLIFLARTYTMEMKVKSGMSLYKLRVSNYVYQNL